VQRRHQAQRRVHPGQPAGRAARQCARLLHGWWVPGRRARGAGAGPRLLREAETLEQGRRGPTQAALDAAACSSPAGCRARQAPTLLPAAPAPRPPTPCCAPPPLPGDDAPRLKPDPAIYSIAAERMGVSPAECVVVEDSIVGLKAATGAGMRCVITYTRSTRDQVGAAEPGGAGGAGGEGEGGGRGGGGALRRASPSAQAAGKLLRTEPACPCRRASDRRGTAQGARRGGCAQSPQECVHARAGLLPCLDDCV
jgi:hypothetical protein